MGSRVCVGRTRFCTGAIHLGAPRDEGAEGRGSPREGLGEALGHPCACRLQGKAGQRGEPRG